MAGTNYFYQTEKGRKTVVRTLVVEARIVSANTDVTLLVGACYTWNPCMRVGDSVGHFHAYLQASDSLEAKNQAH